MREQLANWLAHWATKISVESKFIREPKKQKDYFIRTKRAINELNYLIYQLPSGQHLWIDWTTSRTQICLRSVNEQGEVHVEYPPEMRMKWESLRRGSQHA